jgi:hypothetical protein
MERVEGRKTARRGGKGEMKMHWVSKVGGEQMGKGENGRVV